MKIQLPKIGDTWKFQFSNDGYNLNKITDIVDNRMMITNTARRGKNSNILQWPGILLSMTYQYILYGNYKKVN